MKKLKQSVPILLLALAAAGCGEVEARLHAGKEATVNRTWAAAELASVEVAEINGDISVEAGDVTEITLAARATGDLEDQKPGTENEGLFQTTIEGDTLKIGRRKQKRHGFQFIWNVRDETRIDYVLKVPRTMDIETVTVNGKIVTRGLEGETEAVTVNGTMDLEVAGNRELRATTVNGRVKAKFTREFSGARFRTVNGGVEAVLPASASFDAEFSQVNGGFDASFPLNIHSNPGSRRVSGEVNGGRYELKIVTVNGDIELGRGI